MDELIGTIMLWPLNWAPQGWYFCNGQTLSVSQNQALFSLLGTTYGGNGETTFNLPDLRGRVPVGFDMESTPPAGQPNLTLGQTGGEANHTLLTTEMPAHTHTAVATAGTTTLNVSSANASQSAATAGASIATPGSLNGRTFTGTLGFDTAAPNTALNAGSISSTGGTVTNQPTGGSQPHNNM